MKLVANLYEASKKLVRSPLRAWLCR